MAPYRAMRFLPCWNQHDTAYPLPLRPERRLELPQNLLEQGQSGRSYLTFSHHKKRLEGVLIMFGPSSPKVALGSAQV